MLVKNLVRSIEAKNNILGNPELITNFSKACELILLKYQNQGRLYIAGNGGSAADAQHLAAEFVSKLSFDRNPLPAEALTVDTSIITAIGNDYGFEHIFSRQIKAKVTNKDVFLGITTSGNSKNILEALRMCKYLNVPSVIFSAKGGGEAAHLADICINVYGEHTSTIQEQHILFAHTLCEFIENSIFLNFWSANE